MRAGRGIILTLTALGLAACDDAGERLASDAAPAKSSQVATVPNAAPSPATTVPEKQALTPEQAERAFADKVRAVARWIGDTDGKEEHVSPDDVFTPLISAGIVGKDFDREYDYGAWSRPRRPLRFLGHNVVLVFAEEIRGPWIGCCVDQGVTLYLHKDGDAAALQQFADKTRCKVEPANENLYLGSLQSAGQPLKDADNLLALACHERDIFDDQAR